MIKFMVTERSNYAFIRNDEGKTAIKPMHETPLQPTFMESCVLVYILQHIEPEIRTDVCGMIYTRNADDISYIMTIKPRDKLLRHPNDGWTFK